MIIDSLLTTCRPQYVYCIYIVVCKWFIGIMAEATSHNHRFFFFIAGGWLSYESVQSSSWASGMLSEATRWDPPAPLSPFAGISQAYCFHQRAREITRRYGWLVTDAIKDFDRLFDLGGPERRHDATSGPGWKWTVFLAKDYYYFFYLLLYGQRRDLGFLTPDLAIKRTCHPFPFYYKGCLHCL